MKPRRWHIPLLLFCLATASGITPNASTTASTTDEITMAMQTMASDFQVEMEVKAYGDPDKDLSAYKTFALEATSLDNPLLEKELFKLVEQKLVAAGLTRNEETPAILVVMHYFVGKRAQYPQTMPLVTIRQPYQWNIGSGAAPAAAPPGSDFYYRNIRLFFLDYAELAKGAKLRLPPLVWMGEVGSEGSSKDIRMVARELLHGLFEEYPKSSGKPVDRFVLKYIHGTLGVRFDAQDLRIIRAVIPGGPAAGAGLHADDKILKIDGGSPSASLSWTTTWGLDAYRKKDPYYLNVLANPGQREIELEVNCPHGGGKVKVKLTPRMETALVTLH